MHDWKYYNISINIKLQNAGGNCKNNNDYNSKSSESKYSLSTNSNSHYNTDNGE